jgi:hypothetical protein
LGWRVHRSIRARRPWLNLGHPVGVRSYVLVAAILLWIDLAALAGSLDYLLAACRRRPAGRMIDNPDSSQRQTARPSA